MKTILFALMIMLMVVSCKKEKNQTAQAEKQEVDRYADLYGNWVGDFVVTESDTAAEETDFMRTNKINLVIKKIENGKVFGQSIVAGNSRTLLGDFAEYNGEMRITLNESGDKKNDGQFVFKIIRDSLKGKWTANDKKSLVWERGYLLTKQPFKYNPKLMLPEEGDYIDYFSLKADSMEYENEDGSKDMVYSDLYRSASDVITKINASTTVLKESELKNLKKLELEIIRNTIFARHGYSFKKKSFRQFFDPVDWYIPITDDMSGKLTLIEQKNILLLNRFQKYAEDNYDSFGR